jgi:carbonic anhydrase/acetyltransferase-like protein (isoleucine patch superfamily)
MLPAASEITFESRGRSLLSGDALIGADVRLWHLADIEADDEHVRFRG